MALLTLKVSLSALLAFPDVHLLVQRTKQNSLKEINFLNRNALVRF